MALPRTIEDREYQVFKECTNGDIAKNTSICNTKELADDIAESITALGEGLIEYNEVSALASLGTSDIVSYTVPVGKILYLTSADFSGENIADFVLIANAATIGKFRTHYTKYNGRLNLNSQKYIAGNIIKLTATNRGDEASNFNATIQGRLLDV